MSPTNASSPENKSRWGEGMETEQLTHPSCKRSALLNSKVFLDSFASESKLLPYSHDVMGIFVG